MTKPFLLASITVGVAITGAYLTGNPYGERKILGSIGALAIIGIASQFDLTAGIADMFSWILIVVIWLTDGYDLMKGLTS